jgi:hypothetical protein
MKKYRRYDEIFDELVLLVISATVGGATVDRLQVILPLDPIYVCALFSKINC